MGEYWAGRKMVFDRVCCGPAMRHRRTADLVGKAYKESAMEFPEPVAAHELDEFKGEAVMAESLAQLLPRSAEIREMRESFLEACGEDEKRARFQRLFEVVVSMWARGEITLRTVESWQDFCERVNRGLSVFLATAKKGEVSAIFTSGGPVSVAVQRALQLSITETLRVAWMSRNCSFSEFLFSGDRMTLSTFNSFPHLDDDSLLTYR